MSRQQGYRFKAAAHQAWIAICSVRSRAPRCVGAAHGSVLTRRGRVVNSAVAGIRLHWSVEEQALAESLGDELGSRPRTDLGHRVSCMCPHRVVRDVQLVSDLGPAVAQGNQSHYLLLAI